jgi:hypothetical protein
LPQVGSFNWASSEPAYVFAQALGHIPKNIWEAVSAGWAGACCSAQALPCAAAQRPAPCLLAV